MQTSKDILPGCLQEKANKNPPPFNASVKWLQKFNKCCGIKYAQCQGEISFDSDTVANYPAIAKQIREEGDHCKDQIYNADETWLLNAPPKLPSFQR